MNNLISRLLVPGLGLGGIALALFFTLVLANPPQAAPQQLAMPVSAPFDETISGSGVVEANTQNIVIGSFLSGIVASVEVQEGQNVEAGAPLFRLDDRAAQANLAEKQAAVASANANIRAAQARLAQERDQLKRAQKLQQGLSVSEERVVQAQLVVNSAEAQIKLAEAQREAASAAVASAQVELDRLTVRAPIAGKILQINLRPGEYLNLQSGNSRTMVMGNVVPLYIRVSIDENDLWRYRAATVAKGALRGNRDAQFELKFVRIEPLVIPKRSLTGETAERVDTRVMDVLYEVVDNPAVPLYVGQLVDVFIAAK